MCEKTVQGGYSLYTRVGVVGRETCTDHGMSDGNVSRAETCVARSNAVSKDNDGRSEASYPSRNEYTDGVARENEISLGT